MTVQHSLASLLQPVTAESFFGEIWGKNHCHIERDCASYFDSLFGARVIEEVLEFSRPGPSAVRLVRQDDTKDPGSYRAADGAIDIVYIRNAFADGYTIVLNSLERSVSTIASLSHAIEVELNFETQINAYITPPESQGFVPHYDDHDVLILQIEGSKIWHLYNKAEVRPHEMRRLEPVERTGLPAPTDLCLRAGDVLYLPRGRIHAAEATSDPSVHLTVGIHAPTVLTLISHALDSLSFRDDSLLVQLPPRYLDDADVQASLNEILCDVVDAMKRSGFMSEGLGSLGDGLVRRGRCRPTGQLVSNAIMASRIDEQTLLIRYQPLYSRVLRTGSGVALQFAQSLVNAGSDHQAAMLFVSKRTEQFRVCDLPGLSAVQQVALARTLILDGFLVRLSDQPGPVTG